MFDISVKTVKCILRAGQVLISLERVKKSMLSEGKQHRNIACSDDKKSEVVLSFTAPLSRPFPLQEYRHPPQISFLLAHFLSHPVVAVAVLSSL